MARSTLGAILVFLLAVALAAGMAAWAIADRTPGEDISQPGSV